jgi:plasmid stabilization system protein ParE
MKLVFTPEAEQQADECDRWWREHRDEHDLFARELAATTTLLREVPSIGSTHTVLDGLPVRRVLLRKTNTHVYYSVDREAELVKVLAVWGAPKGREPKL